MTNEYDEMIRKAFRDMSNKQQMDFLLGKRPDEPISTASNTPAPQMTLDSLKEAIKMVRDSDPLLKNGVQKDWVCVIHPSLINPLVDYFKNNPPPPYVVPTFNGVIGNLEYILGRRTFIINEAPTDRIEYMEEITMRKKYAEHFLRELEMLARMKKEEDEASGEN